MKQKTIDDIAQEAGVAKQRSPALSATRIVSKRTQDRDRAVMEKYSYTPSLLAQGLAAVQPRLSV